MGERAVNPYWLEDDAPARADSRHEGRVDVAIVGAGVTGCSAALRLAESGLRVRVHDRRGIAEGASGRNGGFALRGGAARYDGRQRHVAGAAVQDCSQPYGHGAAG